MYMYEDRDPWTLSLLPKQKEFVRDTLALMKRIPENTDIVNLFNSGTNEPIITEDMKKLDPNIERLIDQLKEEFYINNALSKMVRGWHNDRLPVVVKTEEEDE